MSVYDEEYWLPAYHFPNYQISSEGRIRNHVGDEIEPYFSKGQMRVKLTYGPAEFAGTVYHLMLATFWDLGWRDDIEIRFRDGDPRNLHIFNMALYDADGNPLLFRLDEKTGKWVRRRKNARQVQIVETGEIFDSVKELAEAIGGSSNVVYMCLRGAQTFHKGYTFRFVD